MSQQDQQVFKTNMLAVFLPTFLAVLFAVPMATVLSFAILRADDVQAEASPTATTAITNPASVTCLAPAASTSSGSTSGTSTGTGVWYALPAQSTGDITQNTTETISTVTTNYYDSYNTGSFNNTQSFVDDNSTALTESGPGSAGLIEVTLP